MKRIVGQLKRRLPGTITCRQFDGFLHDYLEGTLPAIQRRCFRLHLMTCPHCDRYLERYRKARALAVEAMSEDDEQALGAVPEELIQAILQSRRLPPAPAAEPDRDGNL